MKANVYTTFSKNYADVAIVLFDHYVRIDAADVSPPKLTYIPYTAILKIDVIREEGVADGPPPIQA